VHIRHADSARDAPAVASIYSPYVTDSVASLEERAPDENEIARRIEQISPRYPWLVAEQDGTVIGYAYGSAHRERAAYRWAAEATVYIDRANHRRGVASALYGALFELLGRQGLQVVCAGITLPNDASVGLHEAFGFELIGIYRRIGWKFGQWRDVGWWQLELAPRSAQSPREPGPPARLAGA
jgi:L-amino acid N-acyltransferase YncA